MNPYWMGAITGVAASFVGLLAGVIVACVDHRLERKRELERWEREERQKALIRRADEAQERALGFGRIMTCFAVLSPLVPPGPVGAGDAVARAQVLGPFMQTLMENISLLRPCDQVGIVQSLETDLSVSSEQQARKFAAALDAVRPVYIRELEEAITQRDPLLQKSDAPTTSAS